MLSSSMPQSPQQSPFTHQHADRTALTLAQESSDLDEFSMSGFQSINSPIRQLIVSSGHADHDSREEPHPPQIYSSQGVDRASLLARHIFEDYEQHRYDTIPPSSTMRTRMTDMALDHDHDAIVHDDPAETFDNIIDYARTTSDDDHGAVDNFILGQNTPPQPSTMSIDRRPLGQVDMNIPETTAKKRKASRSQDSTPLRAQYTSRSLRPRNERQAMPYHYDRAQHTLRQKKPDATDADIQVQMQKDLDRQRKQRDKRSTSARPAKWQRSNSTSSSSLSDLDSDQFDGSTVLSRPSMPRSIASSAQSPVPPNFSVKDVVVRTRFQELMPNYQPVSLARNREGSASKFITEILKKWEKRLAGRTVDYFTISFPWLEHDDTILLEVDGDNQDSYDDMIARIRACPPSGKKCKAADHVYVDGVLRAHSL